MTKQNSTTASATDGQQQASEPAPGTPAPGAAAEAQQDGQQAQQQGAEGAEGAEGTGDGKGGNKAGQEAAKYRKQLRDTEAERDALTGTVDSLRRQLIAQNMPHGSKLNADSLWTAGHNAADLFAADGAVDVGKLSEAVKDTHQKFGVRFGPDPIPGSGTGQGAASAGEGPSWSKALNKNER
jgi:hypothetical protein